MRQRLQELEDMGRIFQAVIPGGMTSILQLGDICINRPCKNFLRKQYLNWRMTVLQEKRANGVMGKVEVKISREQLMTWCEEFVSDFNSRERLGVTNIIVPCLSKVGQNYFSSETKSYTSWLESLNENALYKALLNAHTASKL